MGTRMSSSNAASDLDESRGATPVVEAIPPAILRGGARGLEIVIHGRATTDAIATAVTDRLSEAPTFFRGSDVRIRVDDGPLAPGCLARLDAIAGQFELRIIEVGASPKRGDDAVPVPNLAAGSAPAPATTATDDISIRIATASDPQASLPLPDHAPAAIQLPASAPEPAPAPAAAPGEIDQLELALAQLGTAGDLEPEIEVVHAPPDTRVVIGPVRSGVILEHRGHLFVFGDVNPGAEIRAEGNIVVLGRLRGTAHAGIGRDVGFILALRLEPQQLRIGRMVARASDSDTPAAVPEIAHVTDSTIIVERYLGRLPGALAASI